MNLPAICSFAGDNLMRKQLVVLFLTLAVACWGTVATADTCITLNSANPSIIFNGSGAGGVDMAEFTFDPSTDNGKLTITLTNVSSGGSTVVPANLLTALVWTSTTELATSVSGFNGSAIAAANFNAADNDFGFNWQYKTFGTAETVSGASFNQGVSTAGFGVFGPDGNFPSAHSATNLDGSNYAIAPGNYNGSNGNPPVNGQTLAQSSITFTLYNAGTSSIDICDLYFIYGTSDNEVPAIPGTPVPLPGTAWLLGSGLAGLGFWRRRLVLPRG
jgi:hypothetical protein